jgi:hypothetical protein
VEWRKGGREEVGEKVFAFIVLLVKKRREPGKLHFRPDL